MVPCIGWSHPTPDACTWEHGRLRISKTPWITAEGWRGDLGDGTVPAYSALPVEMNDQVTSRRPVKERHVPLAHTALIVELIRELLAYGSPKMAAGPGDEPPTIGLDIDDVHQAGAPIPLTVALRHVDTDVSGHPVWARLRATDTSGPWQKTVLSWDASVGGFVGELPGQSPGLYDVQIRARQVPTAGSLETTDTVAVVEGGQLPADLPAFDAAHAGRHGVLVHVEPGGPFVERVHLAPPRDSVVAGRPEEPHDRKSEVRARSGSHICARSPRPTDIRALLAPSKVDVAERPTPTFIGHPWPCNGRRSLTWPPS